ncbi:IclR family transcriptional regulator [Amycolatopsis jiangsuensis]|uniref:DNA-binding IclR family transcriptional regulator n=1 Tax=Amycolatopsis jiangsuensis TaxID=1181879 RepID=A0A840IRJ7_9PSEU|nr:IclR family transcriptional regulator [Amycolatopsis jiangsuensis]MBB4684065.1 DNA-binding IclR family transcriptional regulator [Amycolatopsis jiangsuensis]
MELIQEPGGPLSGDTPALRLFALLELIVAGDQQVSLPALVTETGLPKPTLHRMLQQLESAGLLLREADGRSYTTGARLHRLAENLLRSDSHNAGRHVILRHLVQELGESCNITALSRGEVVYLDRVETPEPLQFYLRPGSRVPVHCSASGKLFLAQLPAQQRQRLLGCTPLKQYTPKTITEPAALEAELERIREQGYALDDEEYLPGLVCVAVPVPRADGTRPVLGVAVQAPVMRLPLDDVTTTLPELRRAAEAISRHETAGDPAEDDPEDNHEQEHE